MREAIQRKYNSIFTEFGRSVYEYSKIVISFDERNSFGIYLSTLSEKANVTVLVKNLPLLNVMPMAYWNQGIEMFSVNFNGNIRYLELMQAIL